MISPDTSTLVAFIGKETGDDLDFLAQALADEAVLITPPVVAEALSDPNLTDYLRKLILSLPRVEIKNGFWERAGLLRSKVISKKLKCRFADALIAQFCLDHNLTLIARDKDYRNIMEVAELKCFLNQST